MYRYLILFIATIFPINMLAVAQSALGTINADGVREAILFSEDNRAQTYTFDFAKASDVRFLVASTGSNVTVKLFASGDTNPFVNISASSVDVTLGLEANETYRLDITGPLNGRPLVSLAVDVVESAQSASGQ